MTDPGKPPPLLAVALLFGAKSMYLPHIVNTVSLFLDSSVDLPLHAACKLESLTLLQRIWDSSEVYTKGNTNSPEKSWDFHKFLRMDPYYRQYQFTLSITEAAKLKNLEMVKWLSARFQGCEVHYDAVNEAATQGSLEILQFFHENDNNLDQEREDLASIRSGVGHPVDWNFCISAAVDGRRNDIAWWLYGHVSFPNENLEWALYLAVLQGDIPVAEWLISLGATWRKTTACEVVALGRLDVLEWVAEQGHLCKTIWLVKMAAQNGHLHVVRWLIDYYMENIDAGKQMLYSDLSEDIRIAVHVAAVNGHIQIAQFLNMLTKLSTEREAQVAEPLGRLLKCLDLANGSSFISSKTMRGAAKNGHLDVVQWLVEEFSRDPEIELFYDERYQSAADLGPPYDGTAMDAAASNGHLNALKWLHELQISVDLNSRNNETSMVQTRPICTTRAMDGAAINGHLTIFQSLHQARSEGCTTRAIDGAAARGHLDVVQWLHAHQQEGFTTAAVDGAARNGHLHVVQWLHENVGTPCTTEAMDAAATNGYLEVVKWLSVHRSEGCTTAAMDEAAVNGFLNIVKWLHAHRDEGSTIRAMDKAAKEGHLHVIQWLYSHRSEGCTIAAMEESAMLNHFEVFLFPLLALP